ncbi:MAG: 50S ribosomal protein L7/L12 [Candidatus Harrisonbacteria bacterium CG10_big_fil_rev_8_21_14_0_10_40_38]|uniref:Large ribosomal subunit protein bL12 n=1 Tax=Candidatus Harrisonbacteria bacterium CG10_big_fil_rev_8_21_14_0_10_40_38 TaxID=1974583 RepID=A0A2H0UT23_9BACT|nr:MAG: 50S ribosomal protein L7/L12 [Candidatus Harrisonbacteria bacterium CG10_big_fil_rev_8_21_14_0_10_40_38]
MEKFEDIISKVEKLTVAELAELVKAMEEKFGVSAAVPVAAAGGAAGGDEGEVKSSFDVVLKDGGSQKIQVIKVIREVLELGLKEAKDMAEAKDVVVKAGMKKEDAEALKAKLTEAGATVELK